MGHPVSNEKMQVYIPRFKGQAIQRGRGWIFEIYILIGDSPEHLTMRFDKIIFSSKEAAIRRMREEIPSVLRIVCRAMGLPEPTAVHDLNAGVMEDLDTFKNKEVKKDSQ